MTDLRTKQDSTPQENVSKSEFASQMAQKKMAKQKLAENHIKSQQLAGASQSAGLSERLGQNNQSSGDEQTQESRSVQESEDGATESETGANLRSEQAQEKVAEQNSANQEKANQNKTEGGGGQAEALSKAAIGGLIKAGSKFSAEILIIRLFFGNLLKVKSIPPLPLPELLVVLSVGFFYFVVGLIILSVLILAVTAQTDPWKLVKLFGGEFINIIENVLFH